LLFFCQVHIQKSDIGDVWFDDATTIGQHIVPLDLRSLITARPGMLLLLKVWPMKATTTRPGPRNLATTLPVHGLGITSLSCETRLAVADDVEQFGVMSTVCGIFSKLGAVVDQDTYVPFNFSEHFGGVHVGTLHRMFQLGMLRSKHDVFGEIVFALDSRQVSWTVVHSLDAPRPVALVELATEFAQWSKLSLILKLEQLGWTEVFAIPAGWTSVPVRQGGVREFWRGAIKNTKWYYIALLMSADIFAKGCTALYHGRKEAYYRSLVKLSREQFVRFGLVDAVDNKYNDDIAEILLLLKDLAPGDELAVEQEAFGDVDDDIYDAITVRAFNPPSEIIAGHHEAQVGGRAFHIYHDNHSHQSGRQRAWIVCPDATHLRCFRYRFIDSFDSVQHCHAFLMAWAHKAASGPCSRSEHQEFGPKAEQTSDMFGHVEVHHA
jgi:hypothetical protein